MTRAKQMTLPATLQTKSSEIGYRVKADAAARPEALKTQYGTFAVYHYNDVEPLPGDKALLRRRDFQLQYLGGIARREASEWALSQPIAALVTDDQIFDMAYEGQWVGRDWSRVFFYAEIELIPRALLYDRMRWVFEIAALDALERPYDRYRYNEW